MDPRAALIAAAAASLLADQASKLIVLSSVRRGPARLRVGRIVAGRLLAARGGTAPLALFGLWVVIAVAGLIAPSAGWLASRGAQAGLGLALGGAAGNLIDVAVRGEVVDFIDVKVWPVFNVADMAIVAGVVVALASL